MDRGRACGTCCGAPLWGGILGATVLLANWPLCPHHVSCTTAQGAVIRHMDDSVGQLPEGVQGPLHTLWYNLYKVLAVVLG